MSVMFLPEDLAEREGFVSYVANSLKDFELRTIHGDIVQELCESRGGRPGLSVLTSILVSVDVKNYRTMLRHW